MRLRFLEYERFAVIFLCSFSYVELMLLIVNFPGILPFLTFPGVKVILATLKLTQLGFNSL